MKGPKYVKEFDFNVKPCNYETAKPVKMSHGGYAKGGVTEKATGEKYPSREAMTKHEMKETPRMQREEVMERAVVKGAIPRKPAVRRSVPVAPAAPMLAMKKGGAVPKAGLPKVGKVMGEFKSGELHSGSKRGPVVTSRKQAIAIGLSEARKAGKK